MMLMIVRECTYTCYVPLLGGSASLGSYVPICETCNHVYSAKHMDDMGRLS
jgi:hypothetical protein